MSTYGQSRRGVLSVLPSDDLQFYDTSSRGIISNSVLCMRPRWMLCTPYHGAKGSNHRLLGGLCCILADRKLAILFPPISLICSHPVWALFKLHLTGLSVNRNKNFFHLMSLHSTRNKTGFDDLAIYQRLQLVIRGDDKTGVKRDAASIAAKELWYSDGIPIVHGTR